MNFSKIEKILANAPKFRAQQIKQLIWRDLIDDWDRATTLPIELKGKLKKEAPLKIKSRIFVSKDGRTVKAVIVLEDGLKTETVLMRHRGRNTLCVSSQIGCPLGCVFCATGQSGFKRNLSYSEIVEQAFFFARWLKKESEMINNVVFMGMGEPFLNYNEVMAAIKILNDKDSFNIGSRHISVSTVGITEGIKKFTDESFQANPRTCINFKKQSGIKKHLGVGVNLAISLHAPNDELRSKIMPVNKKYPLADVIKAARDYLNKTNRKIMFEYVMIKSVNDTDKRAQELVSLLKDLPKRLFMINLITYNPTGVFTPLQNLQKNSVGQGLSVDFATGFKPSPPARVQKFKDILMKAGLQAIERFRFGDDIAGACGQLAGNSYE